MADTLESLEKRRAQLLEELSRTGDMRQGSISENYRRCGKRPCGCGQREHPGHGPYYAFTRKVGGKTQTVNLREGPQLRKLRREVQTYQRFRQTCAQLIEVNEALCALRPEPAVESEQRPGLKKKSSRSSRQKSHGKSSTSSSACCTTGAPG